MTLWFCGNGACVGSEAERQRVRAEAFREAKEDCRVSHTVEVQRINALLEREAGLRETLEKIARLDPAFHCQRCEARAAQPKAKP